MDTYDAHAIERKWQQAWEAERAFYVANPPADPPDDSRFYMLEMLPYPSGHLHMGHVLNYTLGDVVTHFRRRHGYKVLRPMGFDSFGLPAENAAIREGGHPREITERNIAAITRQMRRMGWAIDWEREVSAHEPTFYRWTQWLFLKFFERGLAFRKEAPVNWCPNDQTVFSTRPDTLFGATFFVVAPESPLVDMLVEGTERADEVRAYARIAAARPT